MSKITILIILLKKYEFTCMHIIKKCFQKFYRNKCIDQAADTNSPLSWLSQIFRQADQWLYFICLFMRCPKHVVLLFGHAQTSSSAESLYLPLRVVVFFFLSPRFCYAQHRVTSGWQIDKASYTVLFFYPYVRTDSN